MQKPKSALSSYGMLIKQAFDLAGKGEPEQGIALLEAPLAQDDITESRLLYFMHRALAALNLMSGKFVEAGQQALKALHYAGDDISEAMRILLEAGHARGDYSQFQQGADQVSRAFGEGSGAVEKLARFRVMKACMEGRDGVTSDEVADILKTWRKWNHAQARLVKIADEWLERHPGDTAVAEARQAILAFKNRAESPQSPPKEAPPKEQRFKGRQSKEEHPKDTQPTSVRDIPANFRVALFPDANVLRNLAVPVPKEWIRADLPPGVEAPKTMLDLFAHTLEAFDGVAVISKVARLEMTGHIAEGLVDPFFMIEGSPQAYARGPIDTFCSAPSPRLRLLSDREGRDYLSYLAVQARKGEWDKVSRIKGSNPDGGEIDIEQIIGRQWLPMPVYALTEDRNAQRRLGALHTCDGHAVGVLNTADFLRAAQARGALQDVLRSEISIRDMLDHINGTLRKAHGQQEGAFAAGAQRNIPAGTAGGELTLRQLGLRQLRGEEDMPIRPPAGPAVARIRERMRENRRNLTR